jgi:GntR family transcriptional regulator, transcriptional repressor for pyruvate dehydrogenase complex
MQDRYPADGSLKPVDQSAREALSTEVSRRILAYLLAGHIGPGQQLPPERKLAETLGVGRGVVREALKSLALLGLIQVRPGDGTYLKRTDSELLPQAIEWGLMLGARKVSDLAEARRHIEVIVGGLAAQRRDQAALDDLTKLLEEMKRSSGDADRFTSADVAFHLRVAEAAGNETLYQIMLNIRSLLRVWISKVMTAAIDYQPSVEEHVPILDAIRAGDAEAARVAVDAHLERATERLLAALDENTGERQAAAATAGGS